MNAGILCIYVRGCKLVGPQFHRYSPWVEFVDDAFESYNGKQPSGEPGHPCQEEDGERDETFPSGWVGEQRLHINIRVHGIEVYSHGSR